MRQKFYQRSPYLLLGVLVIGIASRINLQEPLDLHTLVLRDVDEDAFQISIDRMRQGWSALDPMRSFSFGFYAYGRLFWLIPGILWYVFHLIGNDAALIFIPRLVSTLFGLMWVICVYETLRFRLTRWQALLGAGFLLLMTGFWKNTFWFHPDHMMTAFALLAMYLFAKDASSYSRRFWRWCVAVGIALASKLAAIIFVPVIGVYLMYGRLTKRLSFTQMVKYGVCSLGCVLVMYVLLNPYVLHPIGFNAIKTQFFIDLYSNATNHGGDPTSITPMSIYTNVIQKYYVWWQVLVLLLVMWVLGTYREIRVRSKQPIIMLTLFWLLLASIYMLTAIHKERQHYYVFPAMFLPLLFLELQGYKERVQWLLLGLILLMQWLQQFPSITWEFSHYLTLTQTAKYTEPLRIAGVVEAELKKIWGEEWLAWKSMILPNGLPVDYASLGMETQSVRKLYGNFTQEMVEGYKDPTRNVFFETPDIIVLTKDLPLLDRTKEDEYKKTVTYPELLASRAFYDRMLAGQIYTYAERNYSYSIIQETKDFVILRQQPKK